MRFEVPWSTVLQASFKLRPLWSFWCKISHDPARNRGQEGCPCSAWWSGWYQWCIALTTSDPALTSKLLSSQVRMLFSRIPNTQPNTFLFWSGKYVFFQFRKISCGCHQASATFRLKLGSIALPRNIGLLHHSVNWWIDAALSASYVNKVNILCAL